MISDDRLRDLLDAARAVRAKAYAPYSRFQVGAALLGGDGRIYAAANVENAAFPQSQCAEASAIGVMVAAGCHEIVAAMVVADAVGDDAVAPCGGCRQRLSEFAAPEMLVHMADQSGIKASRSIGELLPFSFGPKQLGR
jgi:cytidine deaminase